MPQLLGVHHGALHPLIIHLNVLDNNIPSVDHHPYILIVPCSCFLYPPFTCLLVRLDNYAYIIFDEKTSECAVVDPVEPQKLLHIIQHLGAKLTSVLCTHHHWDHAGGNVELIAKKPGLAVYGADARIPEINYVVKDKEEFKVGALTIQALWTHCHTKGCVSYYIKDGAERVVFTGDTLFLSMLTTFTVAALLADQIIL